MRWLAALVLYDALLLQCPDVTLVSCFSCPASPSLSPVTLAVFSVPYKTRSYNRLCLFACSFSLNLSTGPVIQ